MWLGFGSQIARRLALMAVLWLVIAIGLYVFLGDIPYGGGDTVKGVATLFGAIGAVMLAAALILLRRSAGQADLATTGQLGTARIIGLTQTGMYLNDQPQIGMELEITAAGVATYRLTHKEFVPLILLSQLRPGAALAVRVDPAQPSRIVILWSEAPGVSGGAAASGAPGDDRGESLAQVAAAMASAGATRGGIASPFERPEQANLTIDQLRAWLRENGLAGTARIDRLEDSGRIVGDDRLYTMQTTVQIPGRAPMQTEPSAAMVPLDKISRIAVGVALPVRVAPDNPDLLMFEWDKI